MDRTSNVATVASIVTLGAIVITAIIVLGVVAIRTDRDIRFAEGLTGAAALLIAVLGGLVIHRHLRWEAQRNGGPSTSNELMDTSPQK